MLLTIIQKSKVWYSSTACYHNHITIILLVHYSIYWLSISNAVPDLVHLWLVGRPELRGLPHFILGQSMGGAVTLKAHLKEPSGWDGVILVAPMCKVIPSLHLLYLWSYGKPIILTVEPSMHFFFLILFLILTTWMFASFQDFYN